MVETKKRAEMTKQSIRLKPKEERRIMETIWHWIKHAVEAFLYCVEYSWYFMPPPPVGVLEKMTGKRKGVFNVQEEGEEKDTQALPLQNVVFL
jgi:hypothetical protein